MVVLTVRPEDLDAVSVMRSAMSWNPYGGDWFIFETTAGVRYLVCHGYPQGYLHEDVAGRLPYLRRKIGFDYVLCCYPAKVAEVHPDLPVVGTWNCPTTWRLEGDQFKFWPKEQGLNES
jgi:hypothetical protein